MTSAVAAEPQELLYEGNLVHQKQDGAEEPVKDFSIYALMRPHAEQEVFYWVNERGGGGWGWPEQYGSVDLDPPADAVKQRDASVLFEFEGVPNPVTLPSPVISNADKLTADATWEQEDRTYRVIGTEKKNNRDCWKVDVSRNIGHVATLWIDRQKPLLVAAQQRVFAGRGERFLLSVELEAANPLNAEQSAQLDKPVAALLDLKTQLARDPNETNPELTAAQSEIATAAIEPLQEIAASTSLEALASGIARDLKNQTRQSMSVAALAEKFVGQKAPAIELSTIDGEPIPPEELEGKIVLLHFWDYKDEPLVEPYGQVGYLDYLYDRRRKNGVQIYGVAESQGLADPAQVAKAKKGVRRLREFMNLGYPIAADDGTLLEKLGDPRKTGAKLPLWVLIAPDGTIAHYHVGNYDINVNDGLKSLDDEVVKLIKAQKEK